MWERHLPVSLTCKTPAGNWPTVPAGGFLLPTVAAIPPFGGCPSIPAIHTAGAMIISVLVASAAIGLLLVLLVQGGWTSLDRWFVAVLGWAVVAMVIGQYVNQLDLVGLW